jgi:hypothetical protein
MIALFCLFLGLFASPFKSKSGLEAENAALRHQLIILGDIVQVSLTPRFVRSAIFPPGSRQDRLFRRRAA